MRDKPYTLYCDRDAAAERAALWAEVTGCSSTNIADALGAGCTYDWIYRGVAFGLPECVRQKIDARIVRYDYASILPMSVWAEDENFRMLENAYRGHQPLRTIRHRWSVYGHTRWEFADEPADAPHWVLYRDLCRRGITFNDFRYSFIKRSGNEMYLSLNVSPIFRDGRLRGVTGTARRCAPGRPGLYGEYRATG